MSTFTRSSSSSSVASAMRTTVARLSSEVHTWWAMRAAQRLDDEALHDIGIARGEIEYRVRHGRTRNQG